LVRREVRRLEAESVTRQSFSFPIFQGRGAGGVVGVSDMGEF
jgi:hypothetical protein